MWLFTVIIGTLICGIDSGAKHEWLGISLTKRLVRLLTDDTRIQSGINLMVEKEL